MSGESLKKALGELRKGKGRKFEQSIDLIINLKGVDLKKSQINFFTTLPHKIKDKKICAFFKHKSDLVKTVTEPEFNKYKDKKALKNLVKEYDYFIANSALMPKVATTFGKVLGPAGKMPSPQLGILPQENDEEIKKLCDKIASSLKMRAKEASIKVLVGKEKMSDEEITANIKTVYSAVENSLPKRGENVQNVLIKLTMGKPLRIEI